MMKKKSKALLMISGAAALVAGSVLGTIAYLTDSEQAVNTFTVGNVNISLEETDVDNDGNPLENEYRLLPGAEYVKDPTVTVKAGSDSAYVRMILTVHNASAVNAIINDADNNISDFSDFLGGMDSNVWILKNISEDTDADTIAYEYRYYQTVDGFNDNNTEADEKLPALFEKLIIPSTLDGDELQSLYDGGFKMVVDGHAIQAVGFENAEDSAWAAFDNQIA